MAVTVTAVQANPAFLPFALDARPAAQSALGLKPGEQRSPLASELEEAGLPPRLVSSGPAPLRPSADVGGDIVFQQKTFPKGLQGATHDHCNHFGQKPVFR